MRPAGEQSSMATKRLLLAVDEDEDRARAQAQYVTELFDPPDVAVVVHHDFVDNPEGAYVDQVASVRRARERLEAAGFEVDLAETSGDPAVKVLEYAAKVDADLVCIGSRRRSPAGKAVFGSTTQRILLNADRPVLVVPDGAYVDA